MARNYYKYIFGEQIFIGNASVLWSDLKNIWTDSESNVIVFDLSGVKILDSYGIKFLFDCLRTAEANKKTLFLLRPSKISQNIFEGTKLTDIFTIINDTKQFMTSS